MPAVDGKNLHVMIAGNLQAMLSVVFFPSNLLMTLSDGALVPGKPLTMRRRRFALTQPRNCSGNNGVDYQ